MDTPKGFIEIERIGMTHKVLLNIYSIDLLEPHTEHDHIGSIVTLKKSDTPIYLVETYDEVIEKMIKSQL